MSIEQLLILQKGDGVLISDKIIKYCKDRKMNLTDFEKMCGLGNGSVGKWRDNKWNPSATNLKKIEDATGIPMQEWIKD